MWEEEEHIRRRRGEREGRGGTASRVYRKKEGRGAGRVGESGEKRSRFFEHKKRADNMR